MLGILLAVAAGLCWGIGELCTKSVLQGHRLGPLTALAVRSTVALPAIWFSWYAAVRWWRLEQPPEWHQLPGADVGKLVLGSGLLAGAAAMICFYVALAVDDVSRVKPIAFTLAPATAVLLGWLLLGEPVPWRKAAAVLLILAGVALLAADGAKAPSAR